MSGDNLYQLKTKAPVGAFVHFNGTYDFFGQVIAHQPSGYHLIRGMGRRSPTGMTYRAETED